MAKLVTVVTILLFVVIYVSCAKEKPKRKFYFHGIECNFNSKYITYMKCFIKAVRNKTGLMNVFVITKMPLKDHFISVELFYKFGTIYRTFLVKMTYDACNLVSGVGIQSKVFDIVAKAYKNRYPDLFKPCPKSVRSHFLLRKKI